MGFSIDTEIIFYITNKYTALEFVKLIEKIDGNDYEVRIIGDDNFIPLDDIDPIETDKKIIHKVCYMIREALICSKEEIDEVNNDIESTIEDKESILEIYVIIYIS